MIETRIIPGTEGRYKATSDGRIIGIYGRELKPKIDRRGYQVVCIYDTDHNTQMRFVHRLVALAFIPCDQPDLYQINHKDENKSNNCVDNLEWCTDDYNQHYGTKPARNRIARVMCVKQLDDTGRVVGVYGSQKEAAAAVGGYNGEISKCISGQKEKAYGYRWVRAQGGLKS